MRTAVIVTLLIFLSRSTSAQDIVIDAGKKIQTIRALGVNANPQSWSVNPKAVGKVLDQLIDSMGCKSFRLMFDDCDWEIRNDNDAPTTYDWSFYDSVYNAPRFAQIWEMIHYLNSKGVTDITLSPDGAGPGWMGVTTLTEGKEEEYAESIASMVNFARKRVQPAIQFNKISPVNETTCEGREGMQMTPEQLRKVFHSMAMHLIADSLSDVTLIGPDDCGGWAKNVEAMLSDPVILSKLDFFGQHDYGNSTRKASELVQMVKKSGTGKEVLMTEVNERCIDCDGGTYNKDYGFEAYAGPAYQYILQDLNAGVNGFQIWEAYDSRYHHPNRTLTWSMWGIFGVNDTLHPDVYSSRAHFDVMKQLYRFVDNGDARIDVKTDVAGLVVSGFVDAAGEKLVLTGYNTNEKPLTLSGRIKGNRKFNRMNCFLTNATKAFQQTTAVVVKSQQFVAVIPARTVFTLSTRK